MIEKNIRVTQNLKELTNPKRLIYASFWERLTARLLDVIFYTILWSVFVLVYKQFNDFGAFSILNLDLLIPSSLFFLVSTWFYAHESLQPGC